ncbi:MAG: VWA domain-containing protein [Sedimentisphaeraceae bacterium JB056]
MVNVNYLLLLFMIAVIIIPAYCWSFYRKRRMLRVFADSKFHKQLNANVSVTRQLFKALTLIAIFTLLVIALCRPRWNPTLKDVHSEGRDVVILLDVSRSMLAEDIKPNRLERAKIAIKDLIEKLQGDRIGLITFAGDATVKCPLTQDYGFLKLVLSEISTKSTGVGGTNLGDAIRKASDDVFDNTPKEFKDIILITDGDDQQNSLPVEASSAAGEKGIRIIAVGLGNTDQGSRIPIYDDAGNKTFLTYDGQQVWTKLDEKTLRRAALASRDGKYIPVQTGTFDLGKIYEGIVANSEKRKLEEQSKMEYEEKFQIFLAAALILLVSEMLISEKCKEPKKSTVK